MSTLERLFEARQFRVEVKSYDDPEWHDQGARFIGGPRV